MEEIRTQAEVLEILNKYAQTLRDENVDFHSLYLFGSYARGNPRKWSDIDVAVVVNSSEYSDEEETKLWTLRDSTSLIEPHYFNLPEFIKGYDPMVDAVKENYVFIAGVEDLCKEKNKDIA